MLDDMNTGFSTSNLGSYGIHLNQADDNWMGDQLYALLSGYLPK